MFKKEKLKIGGLFVYVLFILLFIVGCQGAKLAKEPKAIQITQPLAMYSDDTVTASLYWLIVRNGPGAWVVNADWDEYLFVVSNNTESEIKIDRVVVIDSLGTELASKTSMKQLVEGSKNTLIRYKDKGITLESGQLPSTLYRTAAASGAAAGGTIAYSGIMAAGAAGAVLVIIAAVPALVGSGIYRGHVNKKIDKEIKKRATTFPVKIPAGEHYALDLFFPIAPSPRAVEIYYTSNEISHVFSFETIELLEDLHLPLFDLDKAKSRTKTKGPRARY